MTSAVRAIPGESGWPIIGHSLRYIKNCNQLYDEMYAKYGAVYYNDFLMIRNIHLFSPAGNEFVLLDREGNFSSRLAWNIPLEKLFPNGLMLRDGEDHKFHRRLMAAPFKRAALAAYVDAMNPDIDSVTTIWGRRADFLFYPAIKQLTLGLAAKIFLGETLASDADTVNQAFVDLVAASLVLVRYPLPGTPYQRGLRGRRLLETYFRARIPGKRQSPDSDMFAEICRAQTESGESFSAEDIVDHMIFLMMAAHDTTTSSLSSVCYALAQNPEWQARIRADIDRLGGDRLHYDDMDEFTAAGLVLKEALRLYPPLPTIPRAAVRDCHFDDYRIEKGSIVTVSPYFTHRLPEIWTRPDEFDPERFGKARAEHNRHRFAWIPFGGGAHKCLGLNFAELQVKLVLFYLLRKYELAVVPGYKMPYRPSPIGRPGDGLPLILKPLS
ncbi:cytochrome P450 [Exilibacterium tricleocarpae]|nr:cytochrome P450 [Exilibacterium tricleocarpae]